MNLIERLFGGKSRTEPTNRLGGGMSFLFGTTPAGKAVNETTAMQTTTVYACVRILAESIASLPLHLYFYRKDGGKEKAVNNPLYFILHDSPNQDMTSFIFRETMMHHLLIYGNAYAQIIRNGRNEILGLYPLMPNRMEVSRSKSGEII